MKTLILVFVALTLVLATQAFAFQCPSLVMKIDDALGGANLSAAEMKQVKNLRDDGDQHHKKGEHQKAVDTLNKGLKILGV